MACAHVPSWSRSSSATLGRAGARRHRAHHPRLSPAGQRGRPVDHRRTAAAPGARDADVCRAAGRPTGTVGSLPQSVHRGQRAGHATAGARQSRHRHGGGKGEGARATRHGPGDGRPRDDPPRRHHALRDPKSLPVARHHRQLDGGESPPGVHDPQPALRADLLRPPHEPLPVRRGQVERRDQRLGHRHNRSEAGRPTVYDAARRVR